MNARIFICSINRKSSGKVHATKLQVYFLQFEHIPTALPTENYIIMKTTIKMIEHI